MHRLVLHTGCDEATRTNYGSAAGATVRSATDDIDQNMETIMKRYLPIACLALSACATNQFEGIGDNYSFHDNGPAPHPSFSMFPFPASFNPTGISYVAKYKDDGVAVTSVEYPSSASTTSTLSLAYDSTGTLEHLTFTTPTNYVIPLPENADFNKTKGDSIESLGAIGLPTFWSAVNQWGTQRALVADPYAQRWNYQTFGVWEKQPYRSNIFGDSERIDGKIGAMSAGWPTPDTSIPTAGSANFAGALGGVYISPDGSISYAHANVSVATDFAARTLDFSSSGTRTTDLTTFASRPDLDLAGTLTYAPNVNLFNGSLTTSGGTLTGTSTGKFYGPDAQELGGVFFLRSRDPGLIETFGGAYGAKR